MASCKQLVSGFLDFTGTKRFVCYGKDPVNLVFCKGTIEFFSPRFKYKVMGNGCLSPIKLPEISNNLKKPFITLYRAEEMRK